MIGIVDVGGGNRDIYGAGVLDYCIRHHIDFDYFIGVSAGSANGVSFQSKQTLRNYKFYRDYCFRKEYMSIDNFIRDGSYLDLDYIYSTLSNSDGENPVDYQVLMDNPSQLVIVATDALTGEPEYFNKKDIKEDQYDFLKASSCVPGVCKPYEVNGKLYYDGGISDPIPFQKAFEAGCDKVVIILTKPKNYYRKRGKDYFVSKMIRKYPKAASKMLKRSDIYNQSLKMALELEKEGKVLIIAPDNIDKLDTFTKDIQLLDNLYTKGYKDAQKIKKFINS